MTDKQRYYAGLERRRAAETSLRNQTHGHKDGDGIEDLYADMGIRTFAAFQNCLDWLASLGTSRHTQLEANSDMLPQVASKFESALNNMSGDLAGLKEQLTRMETAIGNIEAGLRRIDRYTLDAFRQLTEMDAAKLQSAPQPPSLQPQQNNRRLAKEEARRLALDTAKRMAAAGQSLSLAAVAREAGLKYGQIVYAFGNKDSFMDELALLSQKVAERNESLPPQAQHEVAVAGETCM